MFIRHEQSVLKWQEETRCSSSSAVVGHLTLQLRHLLCNQGLKSLRESGEQAGRQLLLPRLLVLDLQGATESTGDSMQAHSILVN